jgi:LPXTG-motif cell wall-anchored protein
METWDWPQYTFVALYVVSLLHSAYMHDKPKTGVNNFWLTVLGVALGVTVLYFGGFWN